MALRNVLLTSRPSSLYLSGHKSDVGRGEADTCLGHDLGLGRAEAAGNTPLDEAVKDHVDQFRHLEY